MRYLTIEVDEDANVTVEAHGFKGKGCLAVTEAIEKGLGSSTKRMNKAEFYQTETKPAKQSLGRG
jgi:hypothetical protein